MSSSSKMKRLRSSPSSSSKSLSSSSSPSPPPFLPPSPGTCPYIVLAHALEGYSYSIHKIDVTEKKLRSFPKPVMELRGNAYPIGMGFMSYGHKIFFFGGIENETELEIEKIYQDCYAWDISTLNVNKISSSNSGKYRPRILGPIDQKFYVCSCTLAVGGFEVFDPALEMWTSLKAPPIPGIGMMDGEFRHTYGVISYAAVGDCTFLFSTERGIFCYFVETDTWTFIDLSDVFHYRSLGTFPFLGQAECIDGLFYGFGFNASPLYSHFYDKDKLEFQMGHRVRGLKIPSKLVMSRDSINSLLPLQNGWFYVVRTGYREKDNLFYVTCQLGKFIRMRRIKDKRRARATVRFCSVYVMDCIDHFYYVNSVLAV